MDGMKEYIKNLLRESLLTEGGSPILYHFTSVRKLVNILKNDEMYLTPTISSSNEKKNSGGRFYFLSLTRTKSIKHGYGTKFQTFGSVRIKFDGVKLGSRYKILPIDYWQYPRDASLMSSNIGDEMEDRLVSNKDSIPDITKYIISIDILMGDYVDERVIELGKSLGVKINYFTDLNDFASGNESKSVEPRGFDLTDSDTGKSRIYEYSKILGALSYKNTKLYHDIILKLRKNDYLDAEEAMSLMKDVDMYHNKLDDKLKVGSTWAMEDLASSLNADLHNSKTSSDPVIRYITNEFIKVYKKLGADSMVDFFNKLLYIGKKTHDDFNKQFNNDIIKLINNSYDRNMKDERLSGNDIAGDYYENIYNDKDVKNYLDGKISEIKNYVSDYILNNEDMYKYSYVLSYKEIKEVINLDNNSKLQGIINTFEDVRPEEINKPIYRVLYDIDDFYYNEIKKIQDEYYNQFNS